MPYRAIGFFCSAHHQDDGRELILSWGRGRAEIYIYVYMHLYRGRGEICIDACIYIDGGLRWGVTRLMKVWGVEMGCYASCKSLVSLDGLLHVL